VIQPSVLSVGIERYWADITSLGRRYPDLLVIPGVEAAPYYRWEGSPWRGLVLTDWHRHLLVFGLKNAEEIKKLPVLGSQYGGGFDPLRLWPLLLILAAWIVSRYGRKRRACLLAGLGILLLADQWLFLGYAGGPYERQTSWKPYQAL